MFLFEGGVVKRFVLDDRSAQGKTSAEASKRWLGRLSFERVAVNCVCPRASDYVNRTSRGSSRLCGKAIVDHLKFLHDFRRKLGTTRACVLVVVVQAIDGEIVAPRSKTTESEAT